MSVKVIWALILRHWYLLPRSIDRLTDYLFWPLLDVLIWGLATNWIVDVSDANQNVLPTILTGLVYFRVTWQTNYEIGVNLLEESWNKNLTNLLSTPMSKLDWLAANLILSLLKLIPVLTVQTSAIWLIYEVHVLHLNLMTATHLGILIIFGWTIGLVASSLFIILGIRAQALTWTLAFIFAPLAAVYFPLSLLPEPVRLFSLLLPITYVFEDLRHSLLNLDPALLSLRHSFLLGLAMLSLAIYGFNHAFERTRKRGFEHLE